MWNFFLLFIFSLGWIILTCSQLSVAAGPPWPMLAALLMPAVICSKDYKSIVLCFCIFVFIIYSSFNGNNRSTVWNETVRHSVSLANLDFAHVFHLLSVIQRAGFRCRRPGGHMAQQLDPVLGFLFRPLKK